MKKNHLRLLFEVLLVVLYLYMQPALSLFYVLAGTLEVYAPEIAAVGYLIMIATGVFGRKMLKFAVSRRTYFDIWLLTSFPAFVAALVLIHYDYPLHPRGWDAHGFGAPGGLANVLFLPFLHLALWLCVSWFFSWRDKSVRRRWS